MLPLLLAACVAADPAGRSDAPAGSVTARPADGPARVLPANPDLPAGELLIVLPGTTVVSANGAVALTCRADPTGSSPVPVLETAFTLGSEPNVDLAVTLDRGRIDLENRKPDGPAVAVVKLHEFAWTITLDKPRSKVAVELAGRRPPGVRFDPATPPVPPALSAVLVVLYGSASVSDGRNTVGLSAPPGPAQLSWTSTGGSDPKAVKLDRLPAWASPQAERTPEALGFREAVSKLRNLRADNPGAAADALLASKVPFEWRVGLVTAAATDDLPKLAKVLSESADPAVWDSGVTVLRHWLGRGPGQDRRLFQFLTQDLKYEPAAAATVIDLLAGFGPAELNRPETYDVLVEYLQHDRPAVRNLAAWHLVRLVPAGKAIPFRPNASKADLVPAYKEWRRLVPLGTLPAGRAKDAPRRT